MLYRRFSFGAQDAQQPKTRSGSFARTLVFALFAGAAAVLLWLDPNLFKR